MTNDDARKVSLTGLAGENLKPYIQQPNSLRAYALAAAAILSILALNTAVRFFAPIPPLALLFPAILLGGLFCGPRPTVLAASLGLIIVCLFDAPIGFPRDVSFGDRLLRAGVFVLISGLVIWITTTLRRALIEAESARLKVDAALGQGNVGAWEVDLETHMVRASASAHDMFGLPYTGRAMHIDRWLSRINPDDVAAVQKSFGQTLETGSAFFAEYRVLQGDTSDKWIMSRGGVIAFGGKSHLVGAFIDVTDRHLAEKRFRETRTLLSTIIETAPALIYAKDRKGRMLLANRPALKLIDKPWEEVEGRTDLEILADATQAAAVVENDRRLMEAARAEQLEELVGVDDGSARVWSSAKAPIRDSTGSVVGLVGVSIEITDQKRVEARLRLLINELNHRVKNTLGVVQAIVVKTLHGTDPAIREILVGRLLSLAAVHDVLTRENWEGVDLSEVIALVLAPYGGVEDPRFHLAGPKLRLNPKAAQALSMGLHELATNAVKHGALTASGGTVTITWLMTEGNSPRLRLTWTEQGGPVVVTPTRSGFGSWLMRRGLPHDLAGTVQLSFDNPDGVVCVIETPVSEVAASKISLLPDLGVKAELS